MCPDHAPAQFTIFGAENEVLFVTTPLTRPSDTLIAVTSSPEEISTPRCLAAWSAAAERRRGATPPSFREYPGRFDPAGAGWILASRMGSKLAALDRCH